MTMHLSREIRGGIKTNLRSGGRMESQLLFQKSRDNSYFRDGQLVNQGKCLRFKEKIVVSFPAAPLLPNNLLAYIDNISITL